MAKINFHKADIRFRLFQPRKIQEHILRLFHEEQQALSKIDFIFCSDEYLLEINKNFLQHDYYTDIITFDLSEQPREIIGEVYISIDRVKENASLHQSTFEQELLRVIFHGCLHLCGYGDKKKREITIMREKEDENLLKFGEII